jgi:tetratricopeptide (TPR) repeat protein
VSSSKRKPGARAGASFFERFREEVAGYAEGVHRLGGPASPAALVDVPDAELRDFLGSWDGAELFIDAYLVRSAAQLEREGGVLWFGETALGDSLGIELERGGRVVRLEEDTGELLVEGSSFARWLEATVVADGVLYDREGEWLDDVFDDDRDELSSAAAVRREKKALKLDPDAPAPAWRLAKAQERGGDARAARKTLEQLVERVQDFAWAWFDLGRLRRGDSDAPGAEAAFVAAANAGEQQGSELAGWFAAHAARAAAERGDEDARARHAARALALDPEVARAQRRAAQARVDEGELDEARELVALAAALLPRDLEVAELARRLAASGKSA